MNPIARKILEQTDRPGSRVAYGVMASATTVNVEGSATAVTVPKLSSVGPLVTGDYVALTISGADVLIVGKVGGGWVDYTPSWTNLTPGNATVGARYIYVPGGMRVTGLLIFGSTTSISGAVSHVAPDSATATGQGVGASVYDDGPGSEYAGVVLVKGGGTGIEFYANTGNVTATNPFTFATGDRIFWDVVIPL